MGAEERSSTARAANGGVAGKMLKGEIGDSKGLSIVACIQPFWSAAAICRAIASATGSGIAVSLLHD